jgi:DNA-binding NarL/FixJ family response regulator
MAERLALEFSRNDGNEPLHTKLSNREYKVFEMLVAGKGCMQIGRELSLSIKTVSTHKVRLFRKMNLSNQADLIRYAIANNLVPNWAIDTSASSETAVTQNP